MQKLRRRYYQYLKLEKGFSDNTIEAYMRDLDKFLSFLEDEHIDPHSWSCWNFRRSPNICPTC